MGSTSVEDSEDEEYNFPEPDGLASRYYEGGDDTEDATGDATGYCS